MQIGDNDIDEGDSNEKMAETHLHSAAPSIFRRLHSVVSVV